MAICSTILSIALSNHVGLSSNYNYVHPHVVYKCEESIFGVYYNSLKKISLYAGKENKLNNNVNIEYGLVSGYEHDILPYLRLTYNDIFIAPAYESDNIGIVIGIELKLGE